MEESNKRLKSSHNDYTACEIYKNPFDDENIIDQFIFSSNDQKVDYTLNNKKYEKQQEDEEIDDISEITEATDRNFENSKNILMRNVDSNTDKMKLENNVILKSPINNTIINNTSSSNCLLNKQQKEKALLLIPYLIRDFINTGDIPSIIILIKQNFTENCLFKTPALVKRKQGRHYIIEYFQSILKCIPDIILVCNPPIYKCLTINERSFQMITSDMSATGTIISRDSSDYLWNAVIHRQENKAYALQLVDRMSSFFKSFVRYGIHSSGFALHAHAEITIQMTLNEDRTMIESFVVMRRSMKLKMRRL